MDLWGFIVGGVWFGRLSRLSCFDWSVLVGLNGYECVFLWCSGL